MGVFGGGRGIGRAGFGVIVRVFGRLRGFVGLDFDFAEDVVLDGAQLVEADEFEQGEESDDDFGAAGGIGEELGEADGAFAVDYVAEEFDLLADGPFIFEDFPGWGSLFLVEAFEDLIDRAEEFEDGGFGSGGGGFRFEVGFWGLAVIDLLLFGLEVLEAGGGVLVFAVFDELPDEFPAGVFLVFLLDHGLFFDGEEFAAFDVHEGGGHDEELAGDLEVELPHHLDVFDELGGDLGEVDLINIHFLLLHEVKKEVERTFEDFELDLIFGHDLTRAAPQGPCILAAISGQ
jgi:hypothetical protein